MIGAWLIKLQVSIYSQLYDYSFTKGLVQNKQYMREPYSRKS